MQVSGQEQSSRGQRILSIPIWPPDLGISQSCVYETQQVPRAGKTGECLHILAGFRVTIFLRRQGLKCQSFSILGMNAHVYKYK